jgi:hypothetical protein
VEGSVHAAADPNFAAGLADEFVHAGVTKFVAITKIKDAVLFVGEASFDSDPLNPGFQVRRDFFGLCDVDLRLGFHASEVGEFALGYELIHQHGAEFVELQHDYGGWFHCYFSASLELARPVFKTTQQTGAQTNVWALFYGLYTRLYQFGDCYGKWNRAGVAADF